MKSFLDKYQFAIGTVIILLLVTKDALGASIYSLEVTDKSVSYTHLRAHET